MFKPVLGFEGLYEVSKEGFVRNARTLYVLKPRKDSDGYLLLTLWIGKPVKAVTVKLHREVAKAFHPNPLNLEQVNHIDGDRANAAASNLEWVNYSQNHLHAYRVLGRKGSNMRAVLATGPKGELRFESISAAAKAGFNRNSIYKCISGEYSHHHGYNWSIET